MSFKIRNATVYDRDGIARIYILNDRSDKVVTDRMVLRRRLAVGHEVYDFQCAERIRHTLEQNPGLFHVAVHEYTGEILGVAEWTPIRMFEEKTDDERMGDIQTICRMVQTKQDSATRWMMIEAMVKNNSMQNQILMGKRYCQLQYVGVLPGHGYDGIASTLISMSFRHANERNLPLYVEVEQWTPAEDLFKKLGFHKPSQGFWWTDLNSFRKGLCDRYVRMGMIREPQKESPGSQ